MKQVDANISSFNVPWMRTLVTKGQVHLPVFYVDNLDGGCMQIEHEFLHKYKYKYKYVDSYT